LEPEPEPRAPPKVVDLTGVTLASDEGSFSVPESSGGARSGPLTGLRRGERVGEPPAPAPPRAVTRAKPSAVPSLVPLRNLSARTRPPSLDGALRANYPPAARAQGIGGNATVRARISSVGVAGSVRVVSESFPGFGEACRRTVSGSRWTPPQDATGRAVATEIVYRCRFVVDR
jgi:TonB family protein